MFSPAFKKRTLIVLSYVLLFFAIWFVYHYFTVPAGTCTDKIQNQGEKEIDCGGPCSPCRDLSQMQSIAVKEQAVTLGGNNTYDLVAKVTDPNDIFGAKNFKYTFTLKDSEGKVIAVKDGSSYILPADTRYIAELGVQTENNAVPATMSVAVSDPDWVELGSVEKPLINAYNKKFAPLEMGVGSQADGTVRNDSPYDLKNISITILLRGSDGKIIGVNQTQAVSVRVKEERDFRLTWPYSLGADVASMEVDAQSNVFDSANFSSSLSADRSTGSARQ